MKESIINYREPLKTSRERKTREKFLRPRRGKVLLYVVITGLSRNAGIGNFRAFFRRARFLEVPYRCINKENNFRKIFALFNAWWRWSTTLQFSTRVSQSFLILFLFHFGIFTAYSVVLTNPGFENGDYSGWTEFGTGNQQAQMAAWAANNGDWGSWFKGWNPNQDSGIYQDASINAGENYTFGAYIKLNDNYISNGGTMAMELIWLDGGNSEISKITLDITAPISNWSQHTINGAAPVGATTARLKFNWTTDGVIEDSQQTSVLLDDVYLTPEPGSLLLAGIVFLFSSAIRKKRLRLLS